MFQLAWIWALAALPLPLLVAVALPRAPHGAGAALRLPFYAEAIEWMDAKRTRGPGSTLLLATLAWCCLVLAAARPQWVGEPIGLPTTGRDLMLAVDLSGSMNRQDMSLDRQWFTRLAVVKQVAGEFIDRRDGDRLGLILFGTRAYLQAPLTFDRKTVRTLLNESWIGLAGEQTAIGDAIGLAIKRLRERPEASRVLVLLTDGANTAGEMDPRDAADVAAKHGIRIYTIGVGAGDPRTGQAGTDLDEGALADIADATGGHFFRARGTAELERVYALLDQLEPVIGEDEQFRPISDLFYWPLAAAALLGAALALLMLGPRGRLHEAAARRVAAHE